MPLPREYTVKQSILNYIKEGKSTLLVHQHPNNESMLVDFLYANLLNKNIIFYHHKNYLDGFKDITEFNFDDNSPFILVVNANCINEAIRNIQLIFNSDINRCITRISGYVLMEYDSKINPLQNIMVRVDDKNDIQLTIKEEKHVKTLF